jgi:4-amino-4-deoxy-L-arabinose transferase-like glycosyltransferase
MDRISNEQLHTSRVILWILCITGLAVGAKNFEMGLSVDGPIYAAIARNVARTGNLFNLDGNVNQLRPFIDHPPLGLWVVAFFFKIFPAADWSARIAGILFYFSFLTLYFFYIRERCGEKTAVWTIVLLWTFSRFSNYFSNVYMDPGLLFFGTASVIAADIGVRRGSNRFLLYSGWLLGVAALFKGMAAGGFLPVICGLIALQWIKDRNSGDFAKKTFLLTVGTAIPVAAMLISAAHSDLPDFFSRYWNSQFTHRMGPHFHLLGIFDAGFWRELLRESNYLAPLALFAIAGARRKELFIPWALFVSFALLLADEGLIGDQYFLLLHPWIAWLIAHSVFSRLNWSPRSVAGATGVVAVIALLILQLSPIVVHGCAPSGEELEVRSLSRNRGVKLLLLDSTPNRVDITTLSRFSWYGEVEVRYPESNDTPVPPAKRGVVYAHFYADATRDNQIASKGWCLHQRFGERSLWLKCDSTL